MSLSGDILQGEALYVAVGVTVREDVNTLLPHLLDEVLELHGDIYDALDRGLVAAGELDQGHQPRLQRELGLNRRGGERDDGPGEGEEVNYLKNDR